MRVYFATNRDPDSHRTPTRFSGSFSSRGVESLRFGYCEVQMTDAGRATVSSIWVAPEQMDNPAAPLGSVTVLSALRDLMSEGQDALVFVHGFNVEFAEAVEDAAVMASLYSRGATELIPIVFSWPSRGTLSGYIDDRSSARASAQAFGRALMKVADYLAGIPASQICGRRIHCLCHSMGNLVLRYGLQRARSFTPGTLPTLFTELILIAADEDADAFDLDYKLAPAAEIAKRITVYCNRNDVALTVSDKLKFNPARLGQNGPMRPHNLPGDVSVVDVTDLAGDITEVRTTEALLAHKLQQHRYHTYNEDVAADIRKVLQGIPQDRIGLKRRYVPSANKYCLG